MWDAWYVMFALGIVTGINATIVVMRWLDRPKVEITAEVDR